MKDLVKTRFPQPYRYLKNIFGRLWARLDNRSSIQFKPVNASPKMMDIIYIPLGATAFGGAERSLLELAEGVAKKGRKVLVLVEGRLMETQFPDIASSLGVKIQKVDWSKNNRIWKNFFSALRVFLKIESSIIHFNISWHKGMWIIPLVARIFSDAKLVGSMRAMPDPHTLVPRKKHFHVLPGIRLWHLPELFIGWMWSRLLHLTIAVNSNDYPKRMVQHYGFRAEKIRTIYNGIKIKKLRMSEEEKRTRRSKLQIGRNDILIAYVGRLSPQKGIRYLVSALLRLPSNYKLLIIGDGPERERLQAIVRSYGLQCRVKFLGFILNPEYYIILSDLVVVPSIWYEAFGRIVAEAMCLGVPVIASKIGGMAELFENGIQGIYVEPRNSTQLAEAIKYLGKNPEKRVRMGKEAKKWARIKYNIERVIELHAKVYDELLVSVSRPKIETKLSV